MRMGESRRRKRKRKRERRRRRKMRSTRRFDQRYRNKFLSGLEEN